MDGPNTALLFPTWLLLYTGAVFLFYFEIQAEEDGIQQGIQQQGVQQQGVQARPLDLTQRMFALESNSIFGDQSLLSIVTTT